MGKEHGSIGAISGGEFPKNLEKTGSYRIAACECMRGTFGAAVGLLHWAGQRRGEAGI
jgi:hypothetical protein